LNFYRSHIKTTFTTKPLKAKKDYYKKFIGKKGKLTGSLFSFFLTQSVNNYNLYVNEEVKKLIIKLIQVV